MSSQEVYKIVNKKYQRLSGYRSVLQLQSSDVILNSSNSINSGINKLVNIYQDGTIVLLYRNNNSIITTTATNNNTTNNLNNINNTTNLRT